MMLLLKLDLPDTMKLKFLKNDIMMMILQSMVLWLSSFLGKIIRHKLPSMVIKAALSCYIKSPGEYGASASIFS